MSDTSIPDGISVEEWNATPMTVRALLVQSLQRLAALEQQVASLQERLKQTSRNSSKPPSSDPPSAPARPKRAPSGRKAGGQPGRVGRTRRRQPSAVVQRVIDVRPIQCAQCGALLLGADPAPCRHQVTDLPRVEPEITEYRRHTLTCLVCGSATMAAYPPDMPPGAFGPRLQATTSYLSGRLGVSQRDAKEALSVLFHAEVSLGSIAALETQVSEALAQPVADAQQYVQAQAAVNVDETGWREKTHRMWLWVAATPLVAVFLLLETRGAVGVRQILGEAFAGIVGSDRWSAYNQFAPAHRQVCWAHLKRDFQKFVDRGGDSQSLGTALLEQITRIFQLWHRVRDGTLARHDFQSEIAPIRAAVQQLLQTGATVAHPQTQHTCANLLKLEPALWTFVTHENVEPTNNHAERCLRRAVLWRRRSFGTQSPTGSRFVERILTTVTSLRLQHRDVLDYLTAACAATLRGEAAPALVLVPSTT